MVKPKERQAFVDVWRRIPDRYLPPQKPVSLERKDLLRVQGFHNGGHPRRDVKKLVARRQSALRESISFSLATPTRQITHEAANGGDCVPSSLSKVMEG
jgi:hypothetical protein